MSENIAQSFRHSEKSIKAFSKLHKLFVVPLFCLLREIGITLKRKNCFKILPLWEEGSTVFMSISKSNVLPTRISNFS